MRRLSTGLQRVGTTCATLERMPQRRPSVRRGRGPVRPTLAAEFLRARDAVGAAEAIGLAMRRVRRGAGQSQREYAAARGWSKSFQARLEARAQDLMLRDILDALTGSGFSVVVVSDRDRGTAAVDDWTASELIARDRSGRRFPAAREAQRTMRPPIWWLWKHSTDITARWPEWTTAPDAQVRRKRSREGGLTGCGAQRSRSDQDASVGTMNKIRVRPKLVVDGADRAIEFYREVLGATLDKRYSMGEAVVFAQLALPSGDVFQLKDADEFDRGPSGGAGGVILDVECGDPDAVVATALDRGAELVFEVADQPYGARQGRIRDPFGHQWIIGTPITKSDDDIQAALDQWAAEGAQ